MSNTPKDHIAKMVNAVIQGKDDEILRTNFKAAVTQKSQEILGLNSVSDEGPEGEPTEEPESEPAEEPTEEG